ncbi:MAG TPA: MG2 domain-containing protein [Terriglobales bacterium]|nr:MG2 domain-containing protein [Terriglobales bacterium]
MRSLRAVVFLMLLVSLWAAVPGFAREQRVYFSLSTDRTYLPTEQPKIRLYAQDVDVLEFRLYRVQDPVQFFSKLDDVHSFGPQYSPKERVDELTWLEKFHDWKYRTWATLRDFFRGQYSARSRAAIRDWNSGRARRTRVTSSAGFADVPILNPQRLVGRWRMDLPPKYVSETSAIPLESLSSGAYVVEATDGNYRAYAVLLVSETALITKSAPGYLLGFAVDRRTGAPVKGCNVTVWHKKKVAGTFATDDQGLGELRFATARADDEQPTYDSSDWALAQCGSNVAMVAPYSLNLSSDPARDWRGYVYTDRPVYRPGHTVRFKGILRKRNGDTIELPTERQVEASITAPDDKIMLTKQFTLSPFGTVHGELELPPNAPLGYYTVSIRNGRGAASGSFYVEEYKKPEYQVKVTPERTRVLQGETVRATIEARYYFGEPVANAKVTYVVHTSRAYMWDEEEDSEETESETGEEFFYGEQVLEQQGTLDSNGRLVVNIPTKVQEKEKVDVDYRIEARVTDAANREISGHNAVLATYASYHLSVDTETYLYKEGETAQVTVGAFDYDKRPIQTQVTLGLFPSMGGEKGHPIATTTGQTGPDGLARLTIPMSRGGYYTLRAKSRSPEVREPTASTWIAVAGRDESDWAGEGRQIQIIPDKKTYAVGDTAKVLLVTGVPEATILVTTEGSTVITREVIHATGPNVTLDVPIRRESQPNFFVSAVFLRDNELYQGSKSLKVPVVEQRLKVAIEPVKQQFVPGESASYNVTVTDSAGRPVSAELSVGVVDDAIYGVRPDTSGDIVSAFYERRYYSAVTTENSLTFYFHGEAGKRSLELAGVVGGVPGSVPARGRALAQVKAGDFVQPRIRKAFPDTAFWVPDVRTDANGRATVRLAFPDSLTTWRTTVRAITTDTKGGSSINRVLVRKNVMVRFAVPRFFRQGDEVTVSAIVHNYLADAKTARVSLDVDGLEVLQGATRDVSIPSRGETKVDWRLRVPPGTEARLLAKALTNEESDAMEITLPVIPYGVKQSVAQSGVIATTSGEARPSLDFPQTSEPTSRTADLEMSPSVAGAILSALDYLTSYPYGCTEQTMSSFLPNIVVSGAMRDLGVKSNVNPDELKKKLQAGLERLYDFQHEDGGWGWWKEDDSMVFMTAYVVAGMSQASAAGYDVRPEAIARGKQFLAAVLKQHPNMIANLRAYVVYALALSGNVDREQIDSVWERRSKLSPEGVALMGLSMRIAGDARVNDAVRMLESSAKQEGDTVYWPDTYDALLDLDMDNSVEATAHAVRLLSVAKADSPLLPKAVLWMMRHRQDGYYWDTTKKTAMVLYGVTEYLRVSKELQADFAASASVNGKTLVSRRFTAADATSASAPSLHLGPASLNANNNLVFTKNGAGRLYWSAAGRYYTTDKKMFQSGTYSLNISRDYYRLVPTRSGEKIVHDVQPLNGPVRVGDVLAVRVVVSGGSWKYLLMEDPIPAGTEFIQRDDLYELSKRPSWWGGWYSRREFHDDRAAFFQTYFDTRHEYFYLLKVVNPGKFRVSPASVQPMYQPSVLATSEPAVVEVQ